MEDIVFGEGLSVDIEDWAVEEDLLAMSEASWEETLREDCINASETYEVNIAELPLPRTEKEPASEAIARFVPPTSSGLLSQKTSNEHATPLIQTNPEQVTAARKALRRRNSAARITKRRVAHIERMEKMKREKSQRTVGGLQSLPPIDYHNPSSSLDLAPMHDYCSTASGRAFEVTALDTLEPITYTTLETLGIVHSMPKL